MSATARRPNLMPAGRVRPSAVACPLAAPSPPPPSLRMPHALCPSPPDCLPARHPPTRPTTCK